MPRFITSPCAVLETGLKPVLFLIDFQWYSGNFCNELYLGLSNRGLERRSLLKKNRQKGTTHKWRHALSGRGGHTFCEKTTWQEGEGVTYFLWQDVVGTNVTSHKDCSELVLLGCTRLHSIVDGRLKSRIFSMFDSYFAWLLLWTPLSSNSSTSTPTLNFESFVIRSITWL